MNKIKLNYIIIFDFIIMLMTLSIYLITYFKEILYLGVGLIVLYSIILYYRDMFEFFVINETIKLFSIIFGVVLGFIIFGTYNYATYDGLIQEKVTKDNFTIITNNDKLINMTFFIKDLYFKDFKKINTSTPNYVYVFSNDVNLSQISKTLITYKVKFNIHYSEDLLGLYFTNLDQRESIYLLDKRYFYVLIHEFGHYYFDKYVSDKDKKKIENCYDKLITEYKKCDISKSCINRDFVTSYSRKNSDEFVAETLSYYVYYKNKEIIKQKYPYDSYLIESASFSSGQIPKASFYCIESIVK